MKILSSFTKRVANSVSSSSPRTPGFLGQYVNMSVGVIEQYTELKSKFLNSPDWFPLILYSKRTMVTSPNPFLPGGWNYQKLLG